MAPLPILWGGSLVLCLGAAAGCIARAPELGVAPGLLDFEAAALWGSSKACSSKVLRAGSLPLPRSLSSLLPSSKISLGDNGNPANFLGFRGLLTLLPHFCQLCVREVGVCGVYPESP